MPALCRLPAPFRALALLGCLACEPRAEQQAPPASAAQDAQNATREPAPGDYANETRSPEPGADDAPAVRALNAACPHPDRGIARAAQRLAERKSRGLGTLEAGEVSLALRAAGAPYVWPHAWTLEGRPSTLANAAPLMTSWQTTFNDGGERRCGVGSATSDDGKITLAVVAVDALADLAPLATSARVGAWLDVQATLLVDASDAKLVVLGPRGTPHTVPTSLLGRRVRARFHVDREGAWLVQVLANVSGGPRPLLEAAVYAGQPPSADLSEPPAPGESTGTTSSALLEMVNAARSTEGLRALKPDSTLARLAQAHAQAMRAARRTAHDAGDGDLIARLARAGLEVSAGENVAHAATVALAHRVLWASPSHRTNLLTPSFDSVGIGVVLDDDGSAWVCEEFGALR